MVIDGLVEICCGLWTFWIWPIMEYLDLMTVDHRVAYLTARPQNDS